MRLGPDFSHEFLLEKIFLSAWKNRMLNKIIFIKSRFFTFFLCIFLRHHVTYVPAGFGKVLLALILGCHGRIQRIDRGPDPPPPPPPEKTQKLRGPKQYWSRSPEKSQSYQASIQCWVIIGPPAKRHLNGVSLAGRWWPAYSGILILPPLIN